MLANPGKVKSVPQPSSVAIVEAQKLLALFGSGNKEAKKLMAEMQEVQKHNEVVAESAKDVVRSISRQMEALKKEKSEHQHQVDLDREELKKRRDNLDVWEGRLSLREREFKSSSQTRETRMSAEKVKLDAREKDLMGWEDRLRQKESTLEKSSMELRSRISEHQERERKMSASINALKNIISNLE